jgi:hypothetical protein
MSAFLRTLAFFYPQPITLFDWDVEFLVGCCYADLSINQSFEGWYVKSIFFFFYL